MQNNYSNGAAGIDYEIEQDIVSQAGQIQSYIPTTSMTIIEQGDIISDAIAIEEINKDKPWREIIKRRFIDGGIDYRNIL